MEELNIVPIYRKGLGEITTGIDIPIPMFCRRKFLSNDKCKKHYMEMESSKEGCYTCPYGFASYVFDIDEDSIIFTCLNIKGISDNKKIGPKIKNELREYREISQETVKKYAEAYKQFEISQNKYDNYRLFIEDILHDIRKFNGDIKIKNTSIRNKAESKPKFAEFLKWSRSITEMGWFMTLRLNNHDFIYNESLMSMDDPTKYNIYRAFDKVRKCLSERVCEKFLDIELRSNQELQDIFAHECIELLPYILLDNSIKYAPNQTQIMIDFKEKKSQQIVTIESLGPMCKTDEIEKLTSQGFRGSNATRVAKGNGIGLYTAMKICELNHINMNIIPDDKVVKRSMGEEYANFKVELLINI